MAANVREANQADFDAVLAQNTVTLVDFWAAWCGPCRMVAPVVEAVADEMAGQAGFAKVDVDKNGALAQKFGVQSIPTLIIFKDGLEAERMVGARGKADILAAMRRWV